MATALDGVVSGTGSSVTLTTKNPVVAHIAIEVNNATVTGVTSTSGLTWQARGMVSGGQNLDLEVWEAVSANPLTNEVITPKFSATPIYFSLLAWGISGANNSTPYRNAAPVTAPSGTVSVPCQAGDFVYAVYRLANISTPTAPGSPWNTLVASNWMLALYQVASAASSGLTVPLGNGVSNGSIGDAIVVAGDPPNIAITVTAPTGVATGVPVTVSGTIQGVTVTSLDYILGSAAAAPLNSFSQSGTNWTGSLPAFSSTGNETLVIEDPKTGVKSASVSFSVVAPSLTFAISGGAIQAPGTIDANELFTGQMTITGTVTNIVLNGKQIA